MEYDEEKIVTQLQQLYGDFVAWYEVVSTLTIASYQLLNLDFMFDSNPLYDWL